ncbi:hypothetical protein N7456_007014 [Penicillium angulare]|uniref:Uncharacterized protein n=1 Tax=Penicillium angulare TaxID=116970 RepID=A0A9W9FIV2_9EURO|nr:hypothetical protein N7456_007014 [Penicillium angulare]
MSIERLLGPPSATQSPFAPTDTWCQSSSPIYGTNSTPALSRRDTRAGTRFNPVSLDEEPDNFVSPTSLEPRHTNTASSESDNRNIAETRGQAPTVKSSRADFTRKQGIKEDWGNLSPSEEEAGEVVAEALYEIYKATMLQNNGEEVKGLTVSDVVEKEF